MSEFAQEAFWVRQEIAGKLRLLAAQQRLTVHEIALRLCQGSPDAVAKTARRVEAIMSARAPNVTLRDVSDIVHAMDHVLMVGLDGAPNR